MDFYNNSSDLSLDADGSQLLDLSEVLPSDTSHSGGGDAAAAAGGDLSLSDLSLDQTIRARAPFSLFAQPIEQDLRSQGRKAPTNQLVLDPEEDVLDDGSDGVVVDEDYGVEEEGEGEGELQQEGGEEGDEEAYVREEEDREHARLRAAKKREEKLQGDIFILKKLNSAFEAFNEALDEAGSANQRVAEQLVETDALLNKYVKILSKSEEFSRLVFDDEWYGAEADEEQIELDRLAAEQKARETLREKALAEQRERERLEREGRDREAREEKERVDREKRERLASRGGVRGVRGTRASMRGMRAAAPPRPESSTSARSRPSAAAGHSTGIPVKRGTTTGRGISRRT